MTNDKMLNVGKKKSKQVYGKDAHNWRDEMKPLLLAAACVTLALEYSKEASLVYQQIIDAWDRPDCYTEKDMQCQIHQSRLA